MTELQRYTKPRVKVKKKIVNARTASWAGGESWVRAGGQANADGRHPCLSDSCRHARTPAPQTSNVTGVGRQSRGREAQPEAGSKHGKRKPQGPTTSSPSNDRHKIQSEQPCGTQEKCRKDPAKKNPAANSNQIQSPVCAIMFVHFKIGVFF